MSTAYYYCKSIGCCHQVAADKDFCPSCLQKDGLSIQSLAERYPEQYRDVGDISEIDVHAVLNLFQVPDNSGCLQQATQLLLLMSTSKDAVLDITRARDLLNRWLQLNQVKYA